MAGWSALRAGLVGVSCDCFLWPSSVLYMRVVDCLSLEGCWSGVEQWEGPLDDRPGVFTFDWVDVGYFPSTFMILWRW